MPAQPTPLRPARIAPPGKPRRVQPIEKAARLISEDRVHLIAAAKVYHVEGEHGVYRVIASEEGIFCPCPARISLCAHVIAVAICRQNAKATPERLMKDLGVGA